MKNKTDDPRGHMQADEVFAWGLCTFVLVYIVVAACTHFIYG